MQFHVSLFDSLFKRNLLSDGNEAFLEQIVKEYPYFTPAQFYLLVNKESGTAGYSFQAAKTALTFNNPYWLNFQQNMATKELQAKSTNIVVEPVYQPQIEVLKEEEPISEEAIVEESIETIPTPEPAITTSVEEIQETVVETDELETDQKEEPAKEELLFEPLHITDYFASQGIKLSEEVKPGDKLGNQLKSFTEWLKTMKRVRYEKLGQVDEKAEQIVQAQAEKSNKDTDVITEAMAEVLLQQGKPEKAKEVYEKLSLLNPSKNAYFAAKIEKLNEV